jgi:hypothetical protein
VDTIPKGETTAEKAAVKQWLKGRDKFVSGFCNEYGKIGQHEGMKPEAGGKPMPTCKFWDSCPCKCHYDIDRMYQMIGQPRTAPVEDEYKPDIGHFVLPEEPLPVHADALSSANGVNGHAIPEGIGAPVPRAVRIASLPPTPSGRRHRGQLEYDVLDICERWMDDENVFGADKHPGPEQCTPKWVAEVIADEQNVPTPSTGAIQAVWDRWEKLGICTQAKKPARFTGWVGEFNGTAAMLDRIKASKKRQDKSAKAAQKRGFR